MQLWWRQQRLVATGFVIALALSSSPRAEADELSGLSNSSTRLDRVLPHAVLDGISVPDEPIRIATRPTLNWRKGLADQAARDEASQAAENVDPKPAQPAPEETSEDAQPPALPEDLRSEKIAPREGPQLSPAAPPEKAAPQRETLQPETKSKKQPAAEPRKLPAAIDSEAESIQPQQVSKPSTSSPAKKKSATDQSIKNDIAEQKPAEVQQPPEPLTRGLRNLRSRLRTVLSHYYRRPLNNVEHDPWEIMHSMLSFELHSRIQDRTKRGAPITAVGHLCFNRPCKGQRLMRLNAAGELDAPIGVGLQGHKGQFLAMLAQCNVSPDYPIRVSDKEFTIHDLIAAEQKTCYSGEELTFKLIGLGHYLDSDAEWLNDRGESWSIPKLIAEERAQPIRGSACGGTHRLAGLGLAVRRREARGEPIDGEYLEAAKFVGQYHNYAWRLQNGDGSMSTEWFRGSGAEQDLERRIRTSGHTVEWLVYSVADEDLRSTRLVRAVNYLTNLLAHNSDKDWHLGSLGHAVHALVLYDKRVFRPHDDAETLKLAAVDPASSYFRGYKIYRGVLRRTPPESSGFLGLFGSSRTSSRR